MHSSAYQVHQANQTWQVVGVYDQVLAQGHHRVPLQMTVTRPMRMTQRCGQDSCKAGVLEGICGPELYALTWSRLKI